MRKSHLATVGALLFSGSIALAQPTAPLDLEILINGTTITGATSASAIELDGVGVSNDGTRVYIFDSTGAFDGLLSWNGTTLSVFATEFEASGGTGGASAGDLDVGPDGTLYASIFDGSRQRIWRVPSSGWAGAVEMTAAGSSLQLNQIEVDSKNSRLILSYNDAFGSAAEDIVHVPLTATSATPTVLATETAIEAVLATITGYTDDTADDLNVLDMTVQSNGDIIISHGFASNRPINGSMLRITETGTISVFMTAAQIKTAAGVNPDDVNIGSMMVEALSDDQILIHVLFTSNAATLAPFIGVVSADGSSMTVLATEPELSLDTDIVNASLIPGGQFLFRMDGKGGDVAANDDYYFFRQSVGGDVNSSAVLVLRGIRDFLDNSNVREWSLY